jgi:hypothetical protein
MSNKTLEATAAEPGIMIATGNSTSSAQATPLPSGCASALRWGENYYDVTAHNNRKIMGSD